jgi:hypothetical protein
MRRARERRIRLAWIQILACALFLLGAAGILASPSLGLSRGKEMRKFAVQKVNERNTATIVEVSEFHLPTVSNTRGLRWMSIMMLASVMTMFAGVYLFSTNRESC